MLRAVDCLKKYGPPRAERNMVLWCKDQRFESILGLPGKIYMNRDLVDPFEKAMQNIIDRELQSEFASFDGCFNIRAKRANPNSVSLHSWGVAVDINAKENPFGHHPVMSRAFVGCFTDAGFDWGGKWTNPDGMHFQLKVI